MMRLLYRLLLSLHPPRFRREFSGEMLWIFDESRVRHTVLPLFADAFASLARQWLLRTGVWIPIAAGAGALLPLAAGVSIGRVMTHQFHPAPQSIEIEFLELSAITAVIAISCTVTLCVVWFRVSRRHA